MIGRLREALCLLTLLTTATSAGAAQIHCGGASCEDLRIFCPGADPCQVGIVGEGINGPFNVAVTRTHDGQATTELLVLDRLVNVAIRTGSGDDHLNFDDSHFDGTLRISTGRGDDSVNTQDWGVLGHARIDTGPGNDFVFFDAPGIGGPFRLTTGDGDDTVDMGLSAPAVHDGHITFDGGRGTDTLKLFVDPALPPATIKRFEQLDPF
jgi:hypothetical protein